MKGENCYADANTISTGRPVERIQRGFGGMERGGSDAPSTGLYTLPEGRRRPLVYQPSDLWSEVLQRPLIGTLEGLLQNALGMASRILRHWPLLMMSAAAVPGWPAPL